MVNAHNATFRMILDNGLVLLTASRRRLPIVAVLLMYKAGSLYEPEGKTGLAHLAEHMMFRGTPSRPRGSIDLLTGSLGGMNNALTTCDHALYYFVLPSEHWEVPLAIEADRMLHCDFGRESFATELQVAIEERMMLDDDPDTILYEAVDLLALERHPYRNPVVGRMEDLRRLSHEDALRFYRDRYRPDNAVLAVVGDVAPSHVADVVSGLFGELTVRSAPATAFTGPVEGPVTSARRVDVRGPAMSPRVVIAFRSPPADHIDTASLELLSAVLSSGRASRMYARLVEDISVATEVSATTVPQSDPGLFYLSATLHPDESLKRCEREILEILAAIAASGITDAELERARNLSLVDLHMGRETCLGMAGALAFWECLGGWRMGEEYESRLRRATADDVRSVARRYFDPESRSTACLKG